jgi:hypothetical protein
MGGPWEDYQDSSSGPWEDYKPGGSVDIKPAGNWKQTVSSYARPALEIGGAIGGGILAAPANIIAPGVAEVAGTAGGYMLGKEAANKLDEFLGIVKYPGMAGTAQRIAESAPEAGVMGLSGPVVGKALEGTASLIGKAVKPLWGRITGAGTGSIDEAIQSGVKTGITLNPFTSKTDFDQAMRGNISGEDVVNNAKAALQKVKDLRSDAYQTSLAQISQNQAPIDVSAAKGPIKSLLDRYNIKPNPDGSVDISRVAMGKSGRDDIKDIIENISQWGTKPGDQTVVGLDTLKRQLDDFYSESSQARGFVTTLRNIVKAQITKNVPEYENMMTNYSQATTTIKDIEAGLMLRKQGMSGRVVADQTLRRLLSSMKDNFALRKDLVEVLGNQGGEDLSGQIAGYAMRSPVPLGLAGTGPAIAVHAAAAKLINPVFWPVVAASSPRLSGEFLRMVGKTMAEMKGVAPLAGQVMTYGAIGNKTPKYINGKLVAEGDQQ